MLLDLSIVILGISISISVCADIAENTCVRRYYTRRYNYGENYMSDFYIRKFMPNKMHIIAFLFILLSCILFVNGFYRAARISGRHTMMGLTFEPEVYEGDSILLSSCPIEARLKEGEHETAVCWKTISTGIMTDYDCFVDFVAEKYRPVMVKRGTDEYDKYLNGEEVSGYFTTKTFDDFPEYMSDFDNIWEIENYPMGNKITDTNCSQLGIVIVDRQKELLSFLWGIPFLIIGLILLKFAGSPFFYVTEMLETNKK